MVHYDSNLSSELLSNVRSKLPALPDLDPSTLNRLKEQAFAKAKLLQSQVL